ncbi:MAG TPA: sugar phosphate isomerase [Firmicutes bacterium]|jgi:sugar phosphate isomerase/epimerase|nr:sugar phosphate isomerase [Bacillota bacterium]
MKVGLYSISYAGLWYKGEALTVEEFIDRAVKFGYDGIEIDGKRPHGFPLDWPDEKRKKIRKLAESKGLEIIGVASNNNFTSPFMEQRENELLMLAEQIRLCHDLGGKAVRVFLAWRGISRIDGKGNYDIPGKYDIDHISPDSTFWQKWTWAKEALKEAAKIAEKYGITLALQNHEPLIRNYKDIVLMVNEVGSEYLKCCLDCPLLESNTPEYARKAVEEVGDLQVLSHFSGEFARQNNGEVDLAVVTGMEYWPLPSYPEFVNALYDNGYDGYLSYECCHPILNEQHEMVGIEKVDKQVQLAQEYMRRLIREAEAVERKR